MGQNSRYVFRLIALVLIGVSCFVGTFASAAEKDPAKPSFELLKDKADAVTHENRDNGLAYLVSGGAALAVCLPGYFLSKDVFAQTVYSLGQTLGVMSVGYGSYLYFVDHDYTRFVKIVEGVPSLSASQRDQLAASFLVENSNKAKFGRRIRAVTHTLSASLNYLSAATSENRELRTALFFMGGVNTLAAIGAAFFPSEEEKLALRPSSRAQVELVVGQMIGLNLRF